MPGNRDEGIEQVCQLPAYLVTDVLLKVLVRSNVHTDAAVLEPFSLDLVRRTRNSRNDDIRNGKAFLKRQRAWVDNMTAIVIPCWFRFRRFGHDAWTLRVLLHMEAIAHTQFLK